MEQDPSGKSRSREAASSKQGNDKKPRHISSPYSFPTYEETRKRLNDNKNSEEQNAKTPTLEDGHQTPDNLPADNSEEYEDDQNALNKSRGKDRSHHPQIVTPEGKSRDSNAAIANRVRFKDDETTQKS